jgi:hypothetical protein
MPTTVITPNPATVATIHSGILPPEDTAFSSLHNIQQLIFLITGNLIYTNDRNKSNNFRFLIDDFGLCTYKHNLKFNTFKVT